MTDPAVVAALAGGPWKPVAAIVADLDEHYFEVTEARDKGNATTDEVMAAFGKARAANAVEFIARGEPSEAIYEAMAAADETAELRSLLLAILPGDDGK